MRPARLIIAAAVVAAGAAVSPAVAGSTSSAADEFFAGCAGVAPHPSFTVGQVGCQQIPSALLGGTTAFSYYIPPACAPALQRHCPVLYELHGFGGDYTSMLGTTADPWAYVAALAAGPSRDPHTVSDPWNYSDPAAWVAEPSLDAILIAPDGRTVPGGFGPAPALDGYWVDWNPRYAKGGQEPRYPTAAPRFEAEVLHELIPYVETHLPVGRGRAWRGLVGESLGGYGSFTLRARHPDPFAPGGPAAGAMNFLVAPGGRPGAPSTVRVP